MYRLISVIYNLNSNINIKNLINYNEYQISTAKNGDKRGGGCKDDREVYISREGECRSYRI